MKVVFQKGNRIKWLDASKPSSHVSLSAVVQIRGTVTYILTIMQLYVAGAQSQPTTLIYLISNAFIPCRELAESSGIYLSHGKELKVWTRCQPDHTWEAVSLRSLHSDR